MRFREGGWTRRELLRRAVRLAPALCVPGSLLMTGRAGAGRGSGGDAGAASHLDTARRAAAWIESVRITTDHGHVWPWNPEEQPEAIARSLYTGTPGIVLFLLELHHATGDPAVLTVARAGADDLVARLPGVAEDLVPGLYSGLAGHAFVFDEMARVTDDVVYREAATRAVDLLCASARRAGRGVEWSDVTDIVGGGAGIGLMLLRAHRSLGDARALDLAVRAGHRLVELGEPAAGGLSWAMTPTWDREYPNFSHGTAGVAYFLATLHLASGQASFLEAALAGGRYLEAVAENEDGGCRVFHSTPGGEDLFYMSWCHGPAGTARLFHQLHRATGNPRWGDAVHCFARGLLTSGVPEHRTPGFWKNVSQCCGDAGVGHFFLDLARHWPRPEYAAAAKRCADTLLVRASPDPGSGGLKWVQAEHRLRPEWTVAQTGFMQGAAGVGMFFLHLDGFERGRPSRVAWPDSPFA